MKLISLFLLSAISPLGFATVAQPSSTLTPGVLCSASDPDFQGYDYAENVAPGEVLCTTKSGLKLQFAVVAAQSINKISIKVVAADGEHEAVHADSNLVGKIVHTTKSPLLNGLLRFVIVEKPAGDRFEIYTPADLTLVPHKFGGFMKIAFDGGFPGLSQLDCSL